MAKPTIHESAWIDPNVQIGDDTRIWHGSHVQQGAKIGRSCSIGQNVNIGVDVQIKDRVRIQNHVSVFEGVSIEEDVFVGPGVMFTNVRRPRVCFPADHYEKTIVHQGASIGACAVIVSPCSIGKYSMIGAGAVVTHDVPDYALMIGHPARQTGWVCECGHSLDENLQCPCCERQYGQEEDGLVELQKS